MDSKEQKPKRKLFKNAVGGEIAALIVLALVILANVGMGMKVHFYLGTPNTPAGIMQDIKYIPAEWMYTLQTWQPNQQLYKPISPKFDNNTNTQVIKAGVNAVPANEEDINSAGNIISSPTQQGYFQTELIFPALLQTGDRVNIAWKPVVIYANTPETATLKSWYAITIERNGTQLVSGILDKDAQTIEVFKNPVYVVGNVSYFNGITIRVIRNDGSKYEVSLQEPEVLRKLKPLPILDDAPQLEEETIQVENHTEDRIVNIDQLGKIINADTPLVETVGNNTVLDYGIGDQGYTTHSKVLVFDQVNLLNDNGKMEYIPQPTQK